MGEDDILPETGGRQTLRADSVVIDLLERPSAVMSSLRSALFDDLRSTDLLCFIVDPLCEPRCELHVFKEQPMGCQFWAYF